jgi:hypothetical protein
MLETLRRLWHFVFAILLTIVGAGLTLSATVLTRSAFAQDLTPDLKSKAPFSELKVRLLIPTLSFSKLNLPATAEKSFAVENLGTEALAVNVGSPATLNFSVVAGGGSTTLAAKQSETVTVEFAPTDGGSFSDAIVISSNATKGRADTTVKLMGSANGPFSQLKLKGVTLAGLSFAPLNLEKGPTSASKSFSVTNLGTEALSVTVGSPSTQAFSIVAGGGSTTLTAKQSETVTVKFAPISAGSSSGSIVISSDATKGKPDATVKLKGSAKGSVTTSGKSIFVVNGFGDSITSYPVAGNGNIAPSININGANPLLFMPRGIAFDSKGNIYVVNETGGLSGNGSVTIYAAGSNGNATPISVISGPDTGLGTPLGVALDAADNIYVANEIIDGVGGGSITIYPARSNGDTTPSATITNTVFPGMFNPSGIAVDHTSGNIFVVSGGSGAADVVEYAAGSSGEATPIAIISGSNTGLIDIGLSGIALNPVNDDIYVASTTIDGDGIILAYFAGSKGNVEPTAAIEGPNTGLLVPTGVALDSSGTIYVTNPGEEIYGSITVYPASSNGNVVPSETIVGPVGSSKTELSLPYGIAIGP